jgi:hypothetical protein
MFIISLLTVSGQFFVVFVRKKGLKNEAYDRGKTKQEIEIIKKNICIEMCCTYVNRWDWLYIEPSQRFSRLTKASVANKCFLASSQLCTGNSPVCMTLASLPSSDAGGNLALCTMPLSAKGPNICR